MNNIQNLYLYKQDVAWGDMDAFGHVNNVIYYRYVESARIDYLNQIGILNYPIHIVVASSQCKYLSPVVYPDTLQIKVSINEIRSSGFSMGYTIWSESQQKVVAESEAVIVCVSQDNMAKTPIPNELKEKLFLLKR
ncbi:acyl-CoA thioesterase [Acinetobacter equi]|uniref:Thioesterase n=1 Tax=Acinetobacter equi TaxID=1324350 RepID=A0A0N9VBV8_9GAMM|nr:thioesterase family protein [Acinetobacter equi]ALH94562.1 thioesterase [Acinetobacter equi]